VTNAHTLTRPCLRLHSPPWPAASSPRNKCQLIHHCSADEKLTLHAYEKVLVRTQNSMSSSPSRNPLYPLRVFLKILQMRCWSNIEETASLLRRLEFSSRCQASVPLYDVTGTGMVCYRISVSQTDHRCSKFSRRRRRKSQKCRRNRWQLLTIRRSITKWYRISV